MVEMKKCGVFFTDILGKKVLITGAQIIQFNLAVAAKMKMVTL